MTQRTGQFSFFISNQRGASLVEYMLLMVVTLALVKLLSTSFAQPMNKFLNAYMGSYVQCLLEFGELPSLGGETTTGECNARFEPATLADGRPQKSEISASNPPPSERLQDKGSQAEVRQANRTGLGGGSTPSRHHFNANAGVESANTSGKKVVIDLNEDSGSKFFTPSASSSSSSVFQTREGKISRRDLSEFEVEQLNKEQTRRSSAKSSETTLVNQKNKKYTVEPPPKRNIASTEDEGFTFGNFLRWIILAILILFVLIFLGGLLMQFSQASRKST